MKSLLDSIQAILLVVIVGGVLTAIPIIALFIAIGAAVVFVYLIIKEERENPSE